MMCAPMEDRGHIESAASKAAILLASIACALFGCAADERKEGSAQEAKPEGKKAAEEDEARRRNELESMEKEAAGALAAGDFPTARRLIARGNEATSDGGGRFERERGRFLMLRGNLARDQGDEVAARRDYDDAMAIFRVNKDIAGRFEVLLAVSVLEENLGAYAAAGRQLAEAEELLGGLGDKGLEGAFLERSGRLAQRQVRLDDAYTALVEASRIYAERKDRRAQAEVLLHIATVEDGLGKAGECRRSLERANKLFAEIGDKDGEVRSMHRLAAVHEREGRYDKARALLDKTEKLYRELGRSSDAMKVRQHIDALPEGG